MTDTRGQNTEGKKKNIEHSTTPWRGWMGKDEETEIVVEGMTSDFWKQMKLNCGAERHHYSMFNVHLSKTTLMPCEAPGG